MITPQEDTTLQALEANREGLQNDKMKTQHPSIIPTDLLPKHKRPKHHKPGIIRAIGYIRNRHGQLVEDTNSRGRRCIQLIEFKYSADNNTLDTITNIHNIYEPLKQAIQRHDRKKTPSPDHPLYNKQNMQRPHAHPCRDITNCVLQGKSTRHTNI